MSNTFSGQARSNIRRLIFFTFLVGALFATAVFLGLASVGFIEAGPLYHSTFGPKSVVILYFDGPPFELVPYFNQRSQYHDGALGYGSGFTLNSTSMVREPSLQRLASTGFSGALPMGPIICFNLRSMPQH